MKKTYLNPPGSPKPKSYHHVVTTELGRMIFLSGQVAFDSDRHIIGEGDVVAQTRQASVMWQATIYAHPGNRPRGRRLHDT
jgi:enamine deaminase RidA (YjgF/YER057c/UK114 family)